MSRSVTVYAASAVGLDDVFHDAARAVGTAIAEGGHTLVYGGNRQGTMRTLAEAARAGGGDVVGITPQLFVDRGLGDDLATELVVTADMVERKALLEDHADGFVVLPGGFGTLEEVFQTVVGRQLGYHDKPIVLVDLPLPDRVRGLADGRPGAHDQGGSTVRVQGVADGRSGARDQGGATVRVQGVADGRSGARDQGGATVRVQGVGDGRSGARDLGGSTGFWQPLLALLDHVDAHGMTHDGWRSSFHVTPDPVEAVGLAVGGA